MTLGRQQSIEEVSNWFGFADEIDDPNTHIHTRVEKKQPKENAINEQTSNFETDKYISNNLHLIFYGYIRKNLNDVLLFDEIKGVIYSFYTFWDSSVSDNQMVIKDNYLYKFDITGDNDWFNGFSVRITEPSVKWKFKVIRCTTEGFCGIIGITKDNECGKNMGAWFMDALNKSILYWTGMNIVLNSGKQIYTDGNDTVKEADIYILDVDLNEKTLIFSKNYKTIKIVDDICIENGYRIAVAFNQNDCIMKLDHPITNK
eukprot:481477_1